MKRGYYFGVESGEGAGKSTQMKFLKDYLEQKGQEVIIVREPGSTPIAERVRKLMLKDERYNLTPLGEFFGMTLARNSLIRETIQPALERGQTVISDRSYYSSLVYQGLVGGVDLKELKDITDYYIEGVHPDRIFILDVGDIDEALQRAIEVSGTADHFERKEEEFHKKVFQEFRKLGNKDPRCVLIQRGTIPQVTAMIKRELDLILQAR